jgi:hypothetical protein
MGDARYELCDFVVFLPGIMGSTLSRDGVLAQAAAAGPGAARGALFWGQLEAASSAGGVSGMSIPAIGWSRGR